MPLTSLKTKAAGSFLKNIVVSPLSLKLRLPFVTALGEKQISHNLLVRAELSDGSIGHGEASESLAMADQTQANMLEALRRIQAKLVGNPVQDLTQVKKTCRLAWEMEPDFPTAAAAFESALFDAYCKSRGESLWHFFGAKKEILETSYTISAWPASLAAKVARQLFQEGFRQFKIKVSGEMEQDIKRVLTVHQTIPWVSLWVDANQAFSVTDALRFIAELKRFKVPILFIEQPLKKNDRKGLAELRAKTKLPIALDESLQDKFDARQIVKNKLADILNIKLAKSGITGALEIMEIAKKNRLKLMIGCMAESALGLTPSVYLAAGSGVFDYVDLDSHLLVESPETENPSFTTAGSRLQVCC